MNAYFRASFVIGALVMAAAACSSSSSSSAPAEAPDDAKAVLSADGKSLLFHFDYPTPAGTEHHFCKYVVLPPASHDFLVTQRNHESTIGTHHFALLRSKLTALPANNDVFECLEGDNFKNAEVAVMITQTLTGSVDFPAGTALAFHPGDVLLMQSHVVNTNKATLKATTTATLKLADPSAVKYQLGMVQHFDPFIHVPANGKSSAQMRCGVPQDITIVEGSTHFHGRGYYGRVDLEVDGAPSKMIVDNTDWEHPNIWRGELPVAKGSHIRTRCDFQSTDGREYYGGQSNPDEEMCMFMGYYYPVIDDNHAFENCFPILFPHGIGDEEGTGTKDCYETTNCVRACNAPLPHTDPGAVPAPVDKCVQKCFVESCAPAAAPVMREALCIATSCGTECADSASDACLGCIGTKCRDDYNACLDVTCPAPPSP